MTKKRNLAAPTEQQKYFEAAQAPSPEQDEGTRELGELYPFLISGGTNTERYYFTHINDKTKYKFNIRPRYFGDESLAQHRMPEIRHSDAGVLGWDSSGMKRIAM